jgi:hypothetical protein
MTTTSPSWWPTWPTSFTDLSGIYDQTVRRTFGNLYEDVQSDEHKDVGAIAEVFSLVAQGSMWIRNRLFPQVDTDAIFIDLWETAFGILQRGTVTDRQNVILRTARYTLGTVTDAAARAIFAPLFGEPGNANAVTFTTIGAAGIADLQNDPGTTEDQWAKATTSMHISHTGETAEPDRSAALDAIEQSKGAHETWTIGQYKSLKWDTEGGWDTACWQ